MSQRNFYSPGEETLDGPGLQDLQRRKLSAMLRAVLAGNSFYKTKLGGVDFDAMRDDITALPLTTRKELEADQADHPPYGSNLSYARAEYCRLHQTSGSSGRPMRWLDTPQSWEWIKRCWGIILSAAGIRREDTCVFTFSFGPFLGFWGAFDGAEARENLCIPAGGLSTEARLRMILENSAAAVFCTPTYALRMAEVAEGQGLDLRSSAVRAIIVAGEPGGHIPATRQRIEQAWGARVFDHTGMTEIGPSGFECLENPADVHVIESEYIAEVIDPQTLQGVPDGEAGELVITNLGRWGSPVIRYRTGDQVRLIRGRCACGRHFARMAGGILGRIDDMLIVKGNNVFPSAIEAIIRRFPEVAEFRVEAYDEGTLTQVRIDLEPAGGINGNAELAQRVATAIQNTLSFRADVRTVSPGELPRFEMKARRFVRRSGSR